MRAVTLGLKFLLELAALVAYAASAIVLLGWLWGSVVAVVVVAIVIAAWGRWAAPRARRRLPTLSRIPLELVILGGGAIALVLWSPLLAVIDAALIAIDVVLLSVLRLWEG